MEKKFVDSVGPGGRRMVPVADEAPAPVEVASVEEVPVEVASVEEVPVEEAPKNRRRNKNA